MQREAPGTHVLLTTQEMACADSLAMDAGTPGIDLMEAAGQAVADEVMRLSPDGEQVLVLCGPGNNGGDGFVAARLLEGAGYKVRLELLGDRNALKGDAAEMSKRWSGEAFPLTGEGIGGADLIVDAIFGAGLARGVSGEAANVIKAVNDSECPVVAVDVPSGIDGTSGAVKGVAVVATATVSFFRAKPGHFLLPGRSHCGELTIADIGIPDAVLETISPRASLNHPAIWLDSFPFPSLEGHKYHRGHAIVLSGGPESTGAARLGARGALRAGAGLVTLVGSKAATAINAAHETAIMVESFSGAKGFAKALQDERRNAVLAGPGAGVGKGTRELVLEALTSSAACVLDADAITSFEKQPKTLFKAIGKRDAPVVLTPHDGEFSRLFGKSAGTGSRLDKAREGAQLTGAIVVLKGADTVIAHGDGRAVINANAPPWTATAGSGDVLAGIITALLAQGMPAFEAACAGVWLHGACAEAHGPGLIAEDLYEAMPAVLADLYDAGGF